MTNTFDWNKNTWDVIDTYFKDEHVLVKHQLESFNNFISDGIPDVIKEYNPIKIPANYDEESNRFLLEYVIEFKDIYIGKPVINENNGDVLPMYPHDAKLRNLTYSSRLYVDIEHKIISYDTNTEKYNTTILQKIEKYGIGKIPIMLQSKYCILNDQVSSIKGSMGECEYDIGGYFVINGSEKVIVSQERKCINQVYVFPQGKTVSKYSHIAEISSMPKEGLSMAKTLQVKLLSKEGPIGRSIKVQINKVRVDIPLFILFRAFGIISDKSIIEHILSDINSVLSKNLIEKLKPSILEASAIQTEEMAVQYISYYVTLSNKIQSSDKFKLKYVQTLLENEILPHLGKSKIKKAFYLGLMVKKLLMISIGIIQADDRDSFINKRVESTGELLTGLFRSNYGKMLKDMRIGIEKDIRLGRIYEMGSILPKKIKNSTIESGIKYALATGNWGLKNQNNKKGIAQVLNRLSYLSYLSHERRVVAPVERGAKLVEPRNLHNTQWGIICPCETPEGASVGVVKNMSLMCHLTLNSSSDVIYAILEEFGIIKLEEINANEIYKYTNVMVNGNWIGVHNKPNVLTNLLKNLRRQGIINIYTSVSWKIKDNVIEILTDKGRLCRPLYIIKDNKFLINNEIINKLKDNKLEWCDLLKGQSNDTNCNIEESDDIGVIEYIDSNEADTSMISMSVDDINKNNKNNDSYYDYTHCEIHPSMIFGVLVSNIPFPDHNQAPRNLFQGAMGKQAIGIYATSYQDRMDTLGHVLYYPQKPIVSTRPSSYLNSDNIPSGQNPIVAIACYTGYNQEDSLMFNNSAIQRGLFCSSYFKTYKAEEKRNQSTLEDEQFCKPDKNNSNGSLKTRGMHGNYDKLDENGFIKLGSKIEDNDIIIGKVIPLKDNIDSTIKFKDASTILKIKEKGEVDCVYSNRNGDGYRFCKVRLRTERLPQVGDKFASRHGQKGTIGIIYNQEDMPFTKDGVTPDLIVNPHAIPSRMTIAQLIECVLSKIGVMRGCTMDSTPFTGINANNVGEYLEKNYGFSYSGKEVLINGMTGEMMEADIFIGNTFYYKLKHMVEDKMHSRSTGPYQLLTRQPAEGRSRDGGLRFGEMERDCMLSHGSVQFLKERMFDSSDKFFVYVCKKSGLPAIVNQRRNIYKSLYDDTSKDFAKIHIPYSSKLLMHELMCMGILPRIFTKAI